MAFLVMLCVCGTVHAQGAPAQSGGSCGKDTVTFGCHAYIYGSSESAPSYAGKADSVFVDAQYMSQNTGMAQKLNQSGPVPFFYVNAYCENRFGWGCSGPQLKGSSVASQYDEVAQHPTSAEFLNNYNRQIAWVKQAQGKVIEIDNMDFYIEKGHKGAIIKLIQIAANAGLNVFSKNVKDAEILKLPNVVGVVVEEGSGNAPEYHSAFQSVGKPCAGVLMINAKSKAGNQYTSFTECDHPSRGSKSEYTKCTCKKNPSGMQLAGTPVAGPNMSQPPYQPSSPAQDQQVAQMIDAQSTPSASGSQQSSPGSSAPAGSTPQQLPQPQKPLPEPPPFKKIEPEKKEEKKPEPKKEPEKKEKPPVTPPKKAEPRQSPQTKPESVTFYDPLGTAKSKKSAEEAAKVEKKVVRIKPFGDAKLRCTPRILSFITRSTVTWSCGRGATESKGFGFDTGNSLLGSVQVTPKKTQTYSVHCTQDGALVAVAECSISVRKDKAADESFGDGVRNPQDEQKNKTLCMFSFCM